MHMKAWTGIKKAAQPSLAAAAAGSPAGTELHGAHKLSKHNFKGRAGSRAALIRALPGSTIPAMKEGIGRRRL